MSRYNKRNEKSDFEIYVLLAQDNKEFYVGKIKKPNHYQAYKDHMRLKNFQTKELFARSKVNEIPPKMYLLETMNATKTESYARCVVWTRYFLEYGYLPVAARKTVEYANDLLERNMEVYLRIKDIPVGEVLNDEKLLVSTYKFRQGGTKKNTISLCVTPGEYDYIHEQSQSQGLSMSKYCKEMAIDGRIVRVDMSDYLNEIRHIKFALYEIERIILMTGKYEPKDVLKIEEIIKSVDGEKNKVFNVYAFMSDSVCYCDSGEAQMNQM